MNDSLSNQSISNKTEESFKNINDQIIIINPTTAEKKPSMKKDKTNYQNKYV